MVHVLRCGVGIRQRIDAGVRLRCWANSLSDDEGLAAEDAHKVSTALPLVIGLDVALIPGEAEGPRWDLQHEEREPSMRRQTLYLPVHPLILSRRLDRHVPGRIRQAALCPGRDDHVKSEPLRFVLLMAVALNLSRATFLSRATLLSRCRRSRPCDEQEAQGQEHGGPDTCVSQHSVAMRQLHDLSPLHVWS